MTLRGAQGAVPGFGLRSLASVVAAAAVLGLGAVPAGGSPSRPSGAAAPAGKCAPLAPAAIPAGPSARSATVQDARGADPRIDLVRYPRPDTPGAPWSQWGQGLVLPGGRFLSGIGNHLGKDGNAYLFVFDPSTGSITRFADVRELAGDALDWGYGKIHGQIVAGPCGEAYLATYWGTRKGLVYTPRYRGDLMLRVDPSTLAVTSLGTVVPQRGIPSLAGSVDGGMVFGEAVDPNPATDLGRDQGSFFAYDPAQRKVVFRSDVGDHTGFRNVIVDGRNRAYVAATGGRLLQYVPGASELREHGSRLPGGGVLRASAAPADDGTVYGVTRGPDRFFALRSDGTIDDLGAADGYTTSIAAEPDGSRIYFVPGAHGDSVADGTPLIALDPRTGERTTIARLDDLVRRELGLRTAGTYSVVLDSQRRLLYVGLNAGASAEEPWGEVVLAIVHLPGGPTDAGSGARSAAERDASTTAHGSGSVPACRSSDAGSTKVKRSGSRGVTYRAATEGASGAIRFEDVTDRWGASDPLTGMRGHAIAAADVDGDGWTDLFVGTFADRPAGDYAARGATGPVPDRLLRGGPSGFTVDETFPAELGRTSGAAFGDLDGDGDLDLVVARHVRNVERGRAPTVVYRNDGGRFTRVATLSDPAGARSVGLLDYDGDGLLDLFIAEDRFAGGSSVLLRNVGDFAFEDVTQRAGIGRGVAGMGVATGDLDGDGRPDLFVGGSNRLFLNQGDGRFAESGAAPAAWVTHGDEDDPAGVAFGDVNRDGRPDLVVGQHYNSTLDAGRRVPVRLYLNEVDEDGALRLRDVTDEAGLVGLPTKSPHVEIADVDADGWPDIVTTAAGDDGTPIVFRNLGRGGAVPGFEPSSAPGPAQYWVTAAVFDADRDGRLDVVAVEWEPGRPTLVLRNAGSVGHWLGVVAPPGTIVEVSATGSGEGARPLARASVGTATGYGAGPSHVAYLGLGAVERVDVLIDRPGRAPVALRNRRVDRQIGCLLGP